MTAVDLLYDAGPSAIAAIAGLGIAAYTWSRHRTASVAVLLWVGAAIAVGRLPFFAGLPDWQDADRFGFVAFGTLAFTPAVLLLLAARCMPALRDLLERTPTSALVVTQAYRFAGVFLIVAYLRGQLPAEVGLVTGVLDTTVATTALLLARYLRGDDRRAPRLVTAWAVLGLVDFGWAMLVVVGSFLGLVSLTPAPVMMGNPPLLVISLFALPFGIFVSVYLMARMRRGRAA